ncbi:hypothetical protein D4R87_02575 [bacterium]|nr:MAG: hypothetical protein D4R87_02575 [bacterium]
MKHKTHKHIIKQAAYCLVCFCLIVGTVCYCSSKNNTAYADTLDQIETEIAAKQKVSRELAQQAKTYSNLVIRKKQEKASLQNQIEFTEAEIDEMEILIKITANDIEIIEIEIQQLEDNITNKEAEIIENRNYLSESIRKIYEYESTELISIALSEDTLSGFFDQMEYVETLQKSLKDTIDSLKIAKKDLNTKKEEVEEKRSELVSMQEEQQYKKNVLDSQKAGKQNLLSMAKNKESEYNSLLSKIKKAKSELLGDLEELAQQKKAELERIQREQGSPASGQASSGWYFKQNDPRWKNVTIGHSKSTLGRYGCAVASVAMVLKYHGNNITPGELAKKPIFYKDLIKWPSEFGNVKLVYNKTRSLVNWDRIDEELSRGYPVIVLIRRTNGTGGHYVVIVGKDKSNGKYIVHDPYFGENIYLDESRQSISALYGGCGTKMDQLIIYHKK